MGANGTLVTAHAGCLGTADNSPASFEAAFALPVDYAEADLRFTAAGEPYLSHDALPAAEAEAAMSLESLLRLTAAHPRVRLNLDLKEYSGVGRMCDLVERAGLRDRVLLTGVTEDAVPAVREGGRGLPYLLNRRPTFVERRLRSGALDLARRIRRLGARGLNTRWRHVTPLLARVLADEGLALSVWTVDDRETMLRMLGLAVDNITSRRIDLLLALRDGVDTSPAAEGAPI